MRIRHPLFDLSPLGAWWDIAGVPDVGDHDRLRALLVLAQNRQILPGPVFFRVPEGVKDDPRWQEMIGASVKQCDCPPRRIILPAHGRSRFISGEPLRLVTLTPAEGEDNYFSPQVVIGPHGGDEASAYVAWQFEHTGLTAHESPLVTYPPSEFPMTFGLTRASDVYPGFKKYTLLDLEHLLRCYGEVLCASGLRSGVTVPVCSIVKIENATVTIELDAAASLLRVSPETPRHECVAT